MWDGCVNGRLPACQFQEQGGLRRRPTNDFASHVLIGWAKVAPVGMDWALGQSKMQRRNFVAFAAA